MLERDEAEHRVPGEWQAKFRQIVEAFLEGDFQLRDHCIEYVASIDPSTATAITSNISAYGDVLDALSPASWIGPFTNGRTITGCFSSISQPRTSKSATSLSMLCCLMAIRRGLKFSRYMFRDRGLRRLFRRLTYFPMAPIADAACAA
jgi:hypothetical protein